MVNFSRWTPPPTTPSPPASSSELSWRSSGTLDGVDKLFSVACVSAINTNRFSGLSVAETSTGFRPNAMVEQERFGRRTRGNNRPKQQLPQGHKEYLGDRGSKYHQAQVLNLADNDNCATYITDVPLSINPKTFFAAIDCGAVATIDVKDANKKFILKAADVVFAKPEAAAKFIAKVNSGPGLYINGQRLSARYNKFGQFTTPPGQTRVVFIEGPEEMMDVDEWLKYFDEYSIYVLEKYEEVYRKNGRVMLEFYFVRIVGQAQTIKQAIEDDPNLQGAVNVGYSRDPCGN